MFSSRLLGWKIVGTLAVLAVLGALCVRWGESVRPAIWRCVALPDVWDGSHVRFQGIAENVGENEFLCRTQLVSVLVRTGEPPSEGDAVEISGIFRADGSRVEARRMRTIPPASSGRLLLNLVSILVLTGVIVNFLRHFAFRPEALRAEGAD